MQLSYQKKIVKAHPWCSVLFHLLTFSIYFSSHQKCKTKMWDSLPRRTSHATAAGRFLRKSNWFRIIYNWNDLPPFPPKNKNEEKSNWHTQILGYILGTETFNEFKMMGFFAVIIHSSIYPFIYAGRCDGSSQFTVRFQKKKREQSWDTKNKYDAA